MKFKLLLLFLICCIVNPLTAQVDTFFVMSQSMNKSVPNIVIIPNDYATQKERFPVLYLLHGADGDYTNWIAKVPSIQEYANQYNIIIVCPDGGGNSWYFDSPIDNHMKYETYISKELIEAIDKKYNTIANTKNRAITGLSMGGHGAFYLAFKHQDVWGAAGSMSGALDIRPFSTNWELPKRLGNFADYPKYWEKNTVINMIDLLKSGKLKLIFDCGSEDFFFTFNKQFHELLVKKNILHDYIERPGNHNWEYWSNSIEYQLLFFHNYFKSNKK